MGTFLAFIGFLAILVAIVMLIVSLVKKNGKVKQWLIIGAVSFVVFVIGAILSPKLEKSNETKTANSPTATEISSSPTATEKQEEHVSYKEVKSYKTQGKTLDVALHDLSLDHFPFLNNYNPCFYGTILNTHEMNINSIWMQ